MRLITCDNVTLAYDGRVVVHDLHMQVVHHHPPVIGERHIVAGDKSHESASLRAAAFLYISDR